MRFLNICATVFLTIDFDKTSGFLLRQIPEKQKAIMQEAKGYFDGTLLKCIASYGLIFLITYLELWAGLGMIKIPYAMTVALVIAVLGILPILGTGSVLIPWGMLGVPFLLAFIKKYGEIGNESQDAPIPDGAQRYRCHAEYLHAPWLEGCNG